MQSGKHKYKAIADDLRRRILSAHLTPGSLMPSESDLMSQYGVGRKTARAALRILIQERRISVRQGARAVVLGPPGTERTVTRIFGLSYFGIPSLSHPYSIAVLRGIQSVFRDYQHEIDLIDLSIKDGSRFNGPNRHKYQRCEGVFLMSPDFDDEDLQALYEAGMSLVTLGVTRKHKWVPIHEVLVDAEGGMSNLISHLVDLGHRRIGVLFVVPYERKSTRYLNRVVLECLNEAVRRDGIDVRPGWIREAADFSREAGYRAAMQLLTTQDERPTAIFAIDEMLALGAREAARELGIPVPDRLSIVAIGNHFPEAELTTLGVPAFNVGVRAAQAMLALREEREFGPMAPLPLPVIIGKTSTFAPRHDFAGNDLTTANPNSDYAVTPHHPFRNTLPPENPE